MGNICKYVRQDNPFRFKGYYYDVELKITMEAFGEEHKKLILDSLTEKGYHPMIIAPVL